MNVLRSTQGIRRIAWAHLAGLCVWLVGGAGCSSVSTQMGAQAAPEDIRRPIAESWYGSTPVLDGVVSPGEWSDATRLTGVLDWVPEFSPVHRDNDLSVQVWVKHDRERLHFAISVTDDRIYGVDTLRWLPPENPRAHDLTQEGFPWFGDEVEILINARNRWIGNESAEGNGGAWQMVCNATKSRLGGVGVGGLLEGEPRSDSAAWDTYSRWIQSGAQRAAVRLHPGGRGYTIEWSIRFDPCLELEPGRHYSVDQGEVAVGLNLAIGDLDLPKDGRGNYGLFHHEQWWAGARGTRTQKDNFGTLRLMGTAGKPQPQGLNRAQP